MATGNQTVTTHANFIPEVWSKEILNEIEKNLVLAPLVWRFDQDVAEFGDTVHVPNVTGLTAGDKAANTDVTFETNTESITDILIDKHKYAAFKVEDIVKIQSRYDNISLYSARAGYTLAKAIDTALATLASGFSQSVAAGASITAAELVTAIGYLDAADAPQSGRALVVDSLGLQDLRNEDKFTRYDSTGEKSSATSNGFVTKAYGVPIYFSNNIVNDGGSPALKNNMLFHKEAMALALQLKPKVESLYFPRSLATEVVAHTIFGVKEMRDAFGVRITRTA